MFMPDPKTVQLIHQDRVREAERRIRPLVLVHEAAERKPAPQPDRGIISSFRRWLHTSPDHTPAADPCQPHAV
jgi:hypothetical protein